MKLPIALKSHRYLETDTIEGYQSNIPKRVEGIATINKESTKLVTVKH